MNERTTHSQRRAVPTHVTIPPPETISDGELVPVYGAEVVKLTVEREIATIPLGKGGRPIIVAMFNEIGTYIQNERVGGTFRFDLGEGDKFTIAVDWS